MVTGIGIDLVEIGRFRAMHDPDGFLGEILTREELADHPGVQGDPVRCATLFAVKEAVLKALGCGLSAGSFWRDVRVDRRYHPTLTGAVGRIAGKARRSSIHVSHAASKNYATAIVLIEESI